MEESSLSLEQEAIALVRELESVELPKFRVIGGIVRYEQSARNSMKDTKQRIVSSLSSQPFGCDNYLIWAPPGSGKSFFVQEIAKSMGDHIEYRELNLAQLGERDFRSALTEVDRLDKPKLCFIDEVDSKPSESWPYEALLPSLEPPANRKTVRTCFILTGSSGNSLSGMKEAITKRPKGIDLLSRIPPGNEFVIEGLGLGDRLLVVSTQFLNAAREYNRHIDEVEKLVLYYVALNPKLKSARQIRQLAIRCIERMPAGEERIKFDYLFDAGDPENKEFWTRTGSLRSEFVNTFVRIEDDQDVIKTSSAKPEIAAINKEPITKESTSGKNRIAVLPFANISPSSADEYFADGMTEELISTLSKISGLKVIARTSVMAFKGEKKSITEVANELGVGSLLEGSVRKAGERLRITVQLIDAKTSEHLWTQSYDRELKDVFSIQSDISNAVAEALKVQLLPEENRRILTVPTQDMDAYTLYVKGLVAGSNRLREGLQEAKDLFRKAIAIDPSFAKAYAALADSYALLSYYAYLPPSEGYPRAKSIALQALEQNKDLAEAHASLASVLSNYEWNFNEAEREFKKSLELNPSYASAHHWYGCDLWALGRLEEAQDQIELALKVDPLSDIVGTMNGLIHIQAGRKEKGYQELLDVLKRNPNYWIAIMWLAFYLYENGRVEEAIEWVRKSLEISRTGYGLAAAANIFGRLGRKEDAQRFIEELRAKGVEPSVHFELAWAFAGFDKEKTLQELNRAVETHYVLPEHLRNSLLFGSIQSDPQFVAILGKVGILSTHEV